MVYDIFCNNNHIFASASVSLGSVSTELVPIGSVIIPGTDRPLLSTGLLGTVPSGTANWLQLELLSNYVQIGTLLV